MSKITVSIATAVLVAAGAVSARAPQATVHHSRPQAFAADNAPPCTGTLMVQRPQVRSSCTIDERVSRSPGLLSYTCAGGVATADFGGSHFQGNFDGTNLELTLITQFDFTDRCHWQSLQRIRGPIASGQLTYTYEEAPIPGQRGCAAACTTSAQVIVR